MVRSAPYGITRLRVDCAGRFSLRPLRPFLRVAKGSGQVLAVKWSFESDRCRLVELEAEIGDHLMGVGSFLARRGQVAVDEKRICRVEA